MSTSTLIAALIALVFGHCHRQALALVRLPNVRIRSQVVPSAKSPSSDAFESSVTCKDVPGHNQTCLFQNAYLQVVESAPPILQLLVHEDRMVPEMRLSTWGGPIDYPVDVRILRFSTPQDLQAKAAQLSPISQEGLSILFFAQWHNNWAHGLFDGLYPAFVGAAKFGRHLDKFLPVVQLSSQTQGLDCQREDVQSKNMACATEESFRLFGSNGDTSGKILREYDLARDKRWRRFDEMIIGSGRMGEYTSDTRMTDIESLEHVPAGVGSLRLFIERIYRAHGVEPPVRRSLSSESRPGGKQLQAIITNNKRWSPKLKAMLNDTEHIKTKAGVGVRYVNWGSIRPFKNQLRFLRDVDILVTAPGTAMFYSLFLPDGSVTINLGMRDKSGLPNYGEEFLGRSNRHARMLYLSIPGVREGPSRSDISTLLDKAAHLISSGFVLPIAAPEDNLSIFGRIISDLIARSATSRLGLLGVEPNDPNQLVFCHKRPGGQTSVTDLVYERNASYPKGVSLAELCHIDVAILRQLKREHGLREALGVTSECGCVACAACGL